MGILKPHLTTTTTSIPEMVCGMNIVVGLLVIDHLNRNLSYRLDLDRTERAPSSWFVATNYHWDFLPVLRMGGVILYCLGFLLDYHHLSCSLSIGPCGFLGGEISSQLDRLYHAGRTWCISSGGKENNSLFWFGGPVMMILRFLVIF